MDAATDGRYEIIEVKNCDSVSLHMPIFRKKRFLFTCIGMPAYTRTLGPVLSLPPSKPFKRMQNIRNLVDDFVQKLPEHDSIRLRLPPGDETVFGFALLDFNCEELFTFRVPQDVDIEDVWKNCDQKTRNVIRSAGRKVCIKEEGDFSEFRKLSLINNPEEKNTNDFRIMENIYNAARLRNQSTILIASNESGKNIAASIIVWGSEYAYFWQSARDPACGVGGVNALLLWSAIQMASEMGLGFDFDSFGSAKSAKFLASFGLPPVVRTEVARQSAPYKLFKVANGMVRKRETDRQSARE